MLIMVKIHKIKTFLRKYRFLNLKTLTSSEVENQVKYIVSDIRDFIRVKLGVQNVYLQHACIFKYTYA